MYLKEIIIKIGEIEDEISTFEVLGSKWNCFTVRAVQRPFMPGTSHFLPASDMGSEINNYVEY